MTKRTLLKLLPLTFVSSLWAKTTAAFELKRAHERHYINERWMNLHQSFHYFDYDDPDDMGYGVLRILDDAAMSHLTGTPVHGHKNMEIITVMLEGTLFHQDSLGNQGLLHTGEVQIMSAGRGLEHAETNPSQFETAKALQIWIEPHTQNTKPSYAQATFLPASMHNRLTLLAAPDAQAGVLPVKAHARLYRGMFTEQTTVTIEATLPKSGFYIFIIEGSAEVAKTVLKARDGLGIGTQTLRLEAAQGSDLLVFEVAF